MQAGGAARRGRHDRRHLRGPRRAGTSRASWSDLEVDVANENSTDQLVLSGRAADVELACVRVAELLGGIAQIVPLNVSAPFHSRAMRRIEPELRARARRMRAVDGAGEGGGGHVELHRAVPRGGGSSPCSTR